MNGNSIYFHPHGQPGRCTLKWDRGTGDRRHPENDPFCRVVDAEVAQTEYVQPNHFEGQLKNEAAYQQLLEEVSSIAKAEGWSSETIASNVTTLTRVRDEQDWDYVGPVKGIVISRDEDCDLSDLSLTVTYMCRNLIGS